MKTYSNKDEISLGRGEGIEILKTIKNAKDSVKIVSPYLSPSYVNELVKLREKGVSITLITCDKLEENKFGYSDFKLSDIIKQEKIINPEAKDKKRVLKKISMIFFSFSLLAFVFYFLIFEFIYFSAILFFISLIIFIFSYSISEYNYKYESIFRIKIFDSKSGISPFSTNLIHAKIFLIDEKILFLGSANFTYSAFKTHYETVIKVEDFNAIKDVSNEIENIFNSTELKAKSIDELGREIYR